MTEAMLSTGGRDNVAAVLPESLATALNRIYRTLTAAAGSAAAMKPTTMPLDEHPCLSLQRLRDLFDLSAFERDVLLLCVGAALEARFLSACASLHGDARAAWPTLGLALAALDNPHWSCISRARPLRYWRLIEMGSGALLHAPLQIDERILQYVLGVPALDERMEGVIRHVATEPDSRWADQSTPLTKPLQSALQSWQRPDGTPKLLLLTGNQASMRRAAFVELCRGCECRPFVLNAADLPNGAAERDQLARLWTREAALDPAAVYIETDPEAADQGVAIRNVSAWLRQVRARVALDMPNECPARLVSGLRVEVPELSSRERKIVWQTQLGPVAQRMNGDLDRIVEYFQFDEPGIRLSAAAALDTSASTEQDPGKVAWHICRQYSRRALDSLARRVEPRATWHDLVLPPAQSETLRQIAIHVRQRGMVNDVWGFSSRHTRGLGLSALFAGGSGTGKTMAAEILAGELDLDLYQIDLAGMVSKFIGETEKNLRRIFDAAEESGAILLFDEADALFGKRSEVRDSHDRYANLEVSYLLQRMDSYRGVAILTTNMRHALDSAFVRRIRFIVQFPFPDESSRSRIWERIFPTAAPVDALDFERLAQLNVSGGVIRNIAMHAAFLAAEQQSTIGPAHVLAAARIEYSKLDMPLTAAETRGWA
jgi:hypothetical protein